MTLTGLLLAAALVTGVFSVVTVFDTLHRYIELFSHFRLQYLFVATLLFFALLVLRARLVAVGMLAIAGLNASYVLPWYGVGRQTDTTTDVTLTVLLTNVRAGNTDFDAVAQLIETEQPDVVVAVEMTPAWLAALQPALQPWSYRVTAVRDDPFGIGLFSRLPATSSERIDGPPLGLPTVVTTVTLDDRPVTIVATHPMIPIGADGYEARNAQLEDIAGLVVARDADVLIGDLNTSMWSNTYRRMVATTGMQNVRRGYGVLPSWPTFMPIAMIPLDHCLVAPGIEVLDVRIGDDVGSDHLPLIVTLGFP